MAAIIHTDHRFKRIVSGDPDPRALIGDKAYEADPLIDTLNGRAIIPVMGALR
jgi:hypothetical protein